MIFKKGLVKTRPFLHLKCPSLRFVLLRLSNPLKPIQTKGRGLEMRLLLLILTVSFVFGCATSEVRQFSNVKTGMEKSQVLGLMGSPWTTTRFHGKDRWIYVIYEEGVRHEREVHFLNGSAVYVGDAYKPDEIKTAVVEDKKNEELEKQMTEESAKVKKENKNAYSDYEQEVKGEGKKVRYMPDYEEIK